MTTRPDSCQCCDPMCPIHNGHNECSEPATCTLYRIDMEDHSGTRMCERCADDAMATGVFTSGPDDYPIGGAPADGWRASQ